MRVNNRTLKDSTIMMIDDEMITMEIVKTYLEEEGYSNFHLEDQPSQSIHLLEKVSPDILLLDLVMPEVSGFDVLVKVREHPKFKRLPVIILTSVTETSSKLKALDLGATDFLAKPVDPSELRLRVRNTLAAKAYTDQLTFYDPVTNLPNRRSFNDNFEWIIDKANRYGEELALLNIALDDFGRINASFGFDGGDSVISMIAERIENSVRKTDIIAGKIHGEAVPSNLFRTDGGAFLLILERIEESTTTAIIAKRILEEINRPLFVGGTEICLTASIGISTFPHEGRDRSTLQRLANNAREYVRTQGGNSFQFSSYEINSIYKKRLKTEANLRNALKRGEFVLYYQPKVSAKTEEIQGVEALIRWRDEDNNHTSPQKFISIAEETGLIVPIGAWVLKEACRQIAEWSRLGMIRLGISINLSAKQLIEKNFFMVTRKIIKDSNIDPSLLTIEFTESLLMEETEQRLRQLVELRKIGVKLAIDDFGTGYSSFSYLRRMPVNELKIDRSFINAVPNDQSSSA
ncbi:MAG: EAL domain-containing protein, partial [Desulfofustis sp.]|nr:EAL domain-containing protein [Desulfofustis sp.]